MTRALQVTRIGPGATVQDQGRLGYLATGLSRGGAMDRLALAEGAALLGQSAELAALEMPGMGGSFQASADMRIALTGAPMVAKIDGVGVVWNASHMLARGSVLEIGAARAGAYGYVHVGGGFDLPQALGARSAHLNGRLGAVVEVGDALPVGADPGGPVGFGLPVDDRFGGGVIRIVESFQSALFSKETRQRFGETVYVRDSRANRMGVRLTTEAEKFQAEGGLVVLSESIVQGDIQMTGDGTPFILMAEHQTTGGYPRLGTVIPADLPRAAQAPAGAEIRFEWVSYDVALAAEKQQRAFVKGLANARVALVRDPAEMADLLSYQLIDGVTAGQVD